jgi:hypothetical protein
VGAIRPDWQDSGGSLGKRNQNEPLDIQGGVNVTAIFSCHRIAYYCCVHPNPIYKYSWIMASYQKEGGSGKPG